MAGALWLPYKKQLEYYLQSLELWLLIALHKKIVIFL
jgi:hypothetical protein